MDRLEDKRRKGRKAIMGKGMKKKFGQSTWSWLEILFIIFWPVSIYLIICYSFCEFGALPKFLSWMEEKGERWQGEEIY